MSEATNSKSLNELRKSIDDIDAAIVNLLAERMAVCKQVAA
ncbi:MAG: chorismate mutase, partial [Acidimicrobiaceae bacterium]